MQVLIVIKKNILNKIIVENKTNLVSHLYYIVFDIKKFNPIFRKNLRKTKVVNVYYNKIGNKSIYQGFSSIYNKLF